MTDSNAKQTFDDEELKEALHGAAHGKIGPTKGEFNDHTGKSPSAWTIQNRFGDGSWNDALRNVGLIPQFKPTDEEIVEQLNAISDGDRHPKAKEFREHPHTVSLQTVQKKFGGYNDLADRAGYDPRGSHPEATVTKEQIIGEMKHLSENGKAPTATAFDNSEETVSVSTVQRVFGSFNEAAEEANLETRQSKRELGISEDELIEQLKEHADGDSAPTKEEFSEHPETASPDFQRFGGYNAVVEKADLKPNKPGKDAASKDECIEHLQRLADDEGNAPTQKQVTADPDAPAVVTIKNRFGGWDEAKKAAELA
jgi:hypothetical protein